MIEPEGGLGVESKVGELAPKRPQAEWGEATGPGRGRGEAELRAPLTGRVTG